MTVTQERSVPDSKTLLNDKRLPALPVTVTVLTFAVFGLVYRYFYFPLQNLVLAAILSLILMVVLFRTSFPAFLSPYRLNWVTQVMIPVIGIILALIYKSFALPGGLMVALAIAVFFFGLSLILSSNLFLSHRTDEITPLFRLFPLTSLLLAVASVLVFSIVGKSLIGFIAAGFCLLIVPFAIMLHRGKHYPILSLVTLILVLSIFEEAKLTTSIHWLYDALGYYLIILAIFRNAKQGSPFLSSATAIYVTSGFYLLWLMISFFVSPVADQRWAYKIVAVIGQIAFLFGILENLRTKKDLYAMLFGFMFGALIIVILMNASLWLLITHFNPIKFLFTGIRSNIGNQIPHPLVPPVLITYFISIAFLVKKSGMVQRIALIICLICLWTIFISTVRSAQYMALLVGFAMTLNSAQIGRASCRERVCQYV